MTKTAVMWAYARPYYCSKCNHRPVVRMGIAHREEKRIALTVQSVITVRSSRRESPPTAHYGLG